ncbi:hypothetical protein KR222_003365, partial [Zaprionus bogoriensis]
IFRLSISDTMAKAFFCSENMELCQLLLHEDNAFNCLISVGHNGYLQFNNVYDEDHLINGLYTKKVQLCYELLRIIEYLEEQMAELKIVPTYYENVDTEDRPRESQIPIYEVHLQRINREMRSVMEHYSTLERRYGYLVEKRYALILSNKMLGGDETDETRLPYSDSVMRELLLDQSEAVPASSHLNYLLGSIVVEKFAAFELMLYRLFGRNLLVRRVEIPEPMMQQTAGKREWVNKFVVLMMTTSVSIRPKLIKCCNAFHVTIFECPETPSQRAAMTDQLHHDIRDLELVLTETRLVRKRILLMASIDLFIMRINLNKSMRVYDLLNRLTPVGGTEHQKYLQAECFVPTSQLSGVRSALNAGAMIDDRPDTVAVPRQRVHGGAAAAAEGHGHGAGPGAEGTAAAGAGSGSNFANHTPPILMRHTRKFKHMPPTYFRLNKFTRGFQHLIDSYGMADFRELNPAPYTIITFPFLFAVMFGDLGHGIILCLFASTLIIYEKKIEQRNRMALTENEILNILFAGRYIILLMGVFSLYVGFIYNDVVSMPLNLFGSSWSLEYNQSTLQKMSSELILDSSSERFYTGDPYPIGMDPMWKISGEDSITTYNSLKMKLAIILGISHMMFGLFLAAVNCFHLNRRIDFLLVVIPQFVFMICLFCYLVFLIFFKWLTYGGLKEAPYNSACAPSVLITFIDMMLMKASEKTKNCNEGMFPHERKVEFALVVIAFAAVPILLAGKPIYLMQRHKKRNKQRQERDLSNLKRKGRNTIDQMHAMHFSALAFDGDHDEAKDHHKQPNHDAERKEKTQQQEDDDEVEFDKMEIWIHSGIHTIECVLGSVSHTASYLRLWALSLAHSQLADVLWHMVLAKGLDSKLPIYGAVPLLACAFFVWAILTVAILVMMEGLSAFLHTLRLHWVEFQSKFFSGSGEMFRAFYFPPSTIRS